MNAQKRQKVPAIKCDESEESRDDSSGCSQKTFDPNCRGYALDTLPPEMLETILRLLPLHEVATSVRLVSRHFSMVAATVLNAAFLAAGARIEVLTSRVKQTLWKAKTSIKVLACIKALNTFELIKAQYKLLRAVTWRYTHPPVAHQRFPRLCFYAGSLLDNLNDLLSQVVKYHTCLDGSRNVYAVAIDFVTVCKRYMNFFEKVSERRVNRSALVSGCKVVDILDCLVEGRQVLLSEITKRRSGSCVVNMKLKYVMARAWFTCLAISKNSEENSWRDEQRFMYMRLRRLVGSVNEHLFYTRHYKSKLSLQIPLPFPVKPPPASTYSGYGEYGDQFFYYGNMNKDAYDSKFMSTASSSNNLLDTDQRVSRAPSFDLVIDIELKCSPELAPHATRADLKSDVFETYLETYETKRYRHQQLFLTMTVTCPASMANRLPGTFVWKLRSPRCVGKNS
ncbi:uncharacterized protein LOC117224376 [Megalopta genalis]|uniref:uncharacterized protein LOC117224376 n=1 Tax=Megalopta genalis TaxID=115081 RepID=UPI003FD27C32